LVFLSAGLANRPWKEKKKKLFAELFFTWNLKFGKRLFALRFETWGFWHTKVCHRVGFCESVAPTDGCRAKKNWIIDIND